MIHNKIYIYIGISLICIISHQSFGKKFLETEETKVCCINNPCCPASNLKLCELRADAIATTCLQAERTSIHDICATKISAQQLCTRDLQIENMCANNAQAKRLCSDHIALNELCALKALVNELCVRQLAVENACIKNLRSCSPFSARTSQNSVISYTLGDILPFDTILSDPSGSISQFPTQYTAPETGHYLVTVQVVMNNLTGTTVIGGIPQGSLEIYTNGNLRRRTTSQFLSFSNGIDIFNTTLMYLNAGDVIYSKFNIFVLDPILGLIPYVGQIDLLGNAVPGSFRPFFFVQYLSSDCSTIDCPCDFVQCPDLPCTIECQPCTQTTCQPCFLPCIPTTPCCM